MLLSTHQHKGLKEYVKAIRGFYKSTNKIKNLPYGSVDTIILKSRDKYLVNIIKGEKGLTIVFDQKNYYDLPSLTTAAEEILKHLQRIEKIK